MYVSAGGTPTLANTGLLVMNTRLTLLLPLVLLIGAGSLVVMQKRSPEPVITVYKTSTCGCCRGWVQHAREAGFEVTAHDVADLGAVKLRHGIPRRLSSCHTALVGDYIVEGHVPADVVKKLLSEKPDVNGITAPGMPIGSPGMEGPNAQPYDVLTFDDAGNTAVFVTVVPD